MYQTLMVPLDGSPWSAAALPTAVAIAARTDAIVHVVHVHIPVYMLVDGPVPLLDRAGDQQRRTNAAVYLAGVARDLTAQGVRCTTTLLEGSTAPVLEHYAQQHAIDLVVMTTHGRGAMGRLWFGSVADQLVRVLSVPILLVRPETDAPPPVPLTIQHILIPLDGSPTAEQIIAPTLALGGTLDVQVTLVHVIEQLVPIVPHGPFPDIYAGTLAAARPAAMAYLERIAARIREHIPRVQVAVAIGVPSEVIAAYAGAHKVDLIAIATHGRSGIARMYFGSVATSVLRHAPCPVLLYRPSEPPLVGADAAPHAVAVEP